MKTGKTRNLSKLKTMNLLTAITFIPNNMIFVSIKTTTKRLHRHQAIAWVHYSANNTIKIMFGFITVHHWKALIAFFVAANHTSGSQKNTDRHLSRMKEIKITKLHLTYLLLHSRVSLGLFLPDCKSKTPGRKYIFFLM